MARKSSGAKAPVKYVCFSGRKASPLIEEMWFGDVGMERKRNEEMNAALHELQKCVPHVPKNEKLPKIKILQLATNYIRHLGNILHGKTVIRESPSPRLLEIEDFAAVALEVVQARNSYTDRVEAEMEAANAKKMDLNKWHGSFLSDYSSNSQ